MPPWLPSFAVGVCSGLVLYWSGSQLVSWLRERRDREALASAVRTLARELALNHRLQQLTETQRAALSERLKRPPC